MSYVDLSTIQATDPGDILTAAWCDQTRDNFEFLIDPPACSVSNSAAQSISNNTLTVMSADTESFDNDSMHSTVTNNSRITIQTAGRYLVFINVNFTANATGGRLVGLLRNGSTVNDIQVNNAGAGLNQGVIYFSPIVCAASDYLEARVRQQSGGALDVTLVDFTAVFITR